jgi:hypothetical protein
MVIMRSFAEWITSRVQLSQRQIFVLARHWSLRV